MLGPIINAKKNPPDKLIYDLLCKTNRTVTSRLRSGAARSDTFLSAAGRGLVFLLIASWGVLIWV
jgi:hypothetical protein